MGQKRRFDEFRESMKSLLETGKHSDFVVVCGEDTYNVHKSIVCSQCDFFDAASRFGKEGEEGKIDLADDEPEIVKYMIQYLYELDYHIPSEQVKGPWACQVDWTTVTEAAAEDASSFESNPKLRRTWDSVVWKLSTAELSAAKERSSGLALVCQT